MKYLGKIQDPKDLVTKEYVDNGAIHGVKGTQTAATGAWTGVIDIPALYDGLTIAYYLPYAGSGNATLNLTLSGGGTTGAVNCYFTATTRLTTHYGAGSTIILTYWSAGSIKVAGTATTDNRWTHCDYNTDTYENRINYFSAKTGSKGIWATSLLMRTGTGTYENICTASDGTVTSSNRTTATTKKANTTGFQIGSPIWYTNTTYAANTNITGSGNIYSTTSVIDSRYSINSTLTANFLTPYMPIYLVGTISNGLFYLDTTWWTQTPTDTSKIYVLIGGVYDSTTSNCRFCVYETNTWLYYDGTRLMPYVHDAHTVNGHTVAADVPSGAKFTDTVTTATTSGTGNAVTAITASNGALTVTKGSTFNNYTHPSYTARASGLYKITVDNTGHVSDVASVQKSDITDLGIPGAATDVKIDNTSIVSNGIAGITQAKLGSGYATCTTEEATTAKVATLTNYKPITGGYVSVCFTKGFHKRANTTLNINAQGAYGVSFNASYLDAGIVARSGEIVTFLFDGSYYRVLSVDTRMPRYGSEIDYDQDYTVTEAIDHKQVKLVSGTNIKTINNESLLGSGNISISGGGNFSGTTFYSGNSSTAEHNANSAVKNGNYYYSSNGPAMTLGATTNDGALYVQSYSDSWVGQIAQDYRNGGLFVRGKNNGSWQSWQQVYDTGHTIKTNSTNLPQFSGAPSYLVGIDAFADGGTMKWQSASSVSVGYATSAGSATDSSKLPLTGGTISGNLSVTGTLTTPAFSTDSNNYVKTVSWLQVNGSSDNAAWTDVWVNQNNWLYKRAKSSFISDIKGGFTDYVTDQGTSGSWRYRKWNSGKIEAWYEGTVSSGTTHTQIGSVYRGTWSLSIPTAIGFSSVPKLIIGNNNDATHVISINGKASSTTQISGYYFRPNSNSSSITLYPSIYAWTN